MSMLLGTDHANAAGSRRVSVAYTGHYAQQQVFFDPTTGQMIPADMAAQWTASNVRDLIFQYPRMGQNSPVVQTTGFQGAHYPGPN